jgi:hypothetical protein
MVLRIFWRNSSKCYIFYFGFSLLQVAGSISEEVVGLFNLPNPSSLTVALEGLQTPSEMNTRQGEALKDVGA